MCSFDRSQSPWAFGHAGMTKPKPSDVFLRECTTIRRMKKQTDIQEKLLNSLTGIGVVLMGALGLIACLYVLTVMVRFLFSGSAA